MLAWLSRLMGWHKRPTFGWSAAPSRSRLRAKYDAAQFTEENRRHWAYADANSATAANTLAVRKVLRERSRYERDNGGYLAGLARTLANDCIGSGPRLQLLTADKELNKAVERRWAEWADAVGLAEKLRVMRQAKVIDGEAFAMFVTNPRAKDPVQLDLQLIECDQVTHATFDAATGMILPTGFNNAAFVDGIDQDDLGNPISYRLLDRHPGDLQTMNYHSRDIPADQMLHWFRRERPGQARGIPEVTASIPLFAYLRRFTLATVAAAETAANFSATLESQAMPDGDTDDPQPFDTLEIERNTMVVQPKGWKMSQFTPTQPVATYEMFKRELLKEIGRPTLSPYAVIAGDSSPYNFASAKMDSTLYRSATSIERDHCACACLDRVFQAWLTEATLIPGHLPDGAADLALAWQWGWPGFPVLEPAKEAAADNMQLANGTKTLSQVLAASGSGLDWEQQMEQQALEFKKRNELGLPQPAAKAPGGAAGPGDAGGGNFGGSATGAQRNGHPLNGTGRN